MYLFFETGGMPLTSTAKGLHGFYLCGKNGIYQEATVTAVGDDYVCLRHASVAQPCFAAYRYEDMALGAGLYCGELPVAAFATDRVGEVHIAPKPWMHTDRNSCVVQMETNDAMGDLQQYVQQMDELVYVLNYLYRRMIMICGVSPDLYRDYDLAAEIPYLLSVFEEASQKLDSISAGLTELGVVGGQVSVLARFSVRLRSFIEEPYDISREIPVRGTPMPLAVCTGCTTAMTTGIFWSLPPARRR